MDPVFIDRVEAQNYGCLYDVKLDLTPLHALVGPNDSGKSTILRAVRVMAEFTQQAGQPNRVSLVRDSGLEFQRSPRLFMKTKDSSLDLSGVPGGQWGATFVLGRRQLRIQQAGDLSGAAMFQGADAPFQAEMKRVASILAGPRVLRLDPDSLRQESQLIPENEPVTFFDDKGHRLAGIYDAIQNRGDDSFRHIAAQVRELFPTVKAIRLKNLNSTTKGLEIELTDGARVPAKFVSEGLLYYLAFAAAEYLERPAVLLVEEPENGLHPVRIAEVMKIFREISKTTQVIIATHSPLVVNELSPEEVSVVTRTAEKGTSVRRLSSSANFADRSKVYALGELWLSYANGVDESALFTAQRAP